MMTEYEALRTGDILHCTGKKLLSKLISKATKSTFSHTALYVEIWGQPYVIDAQKNGVNVKPWDEWLAKYDYKFIATRFTKKLDEKTLATKALSKVGLTGYDFEGLLLKQPFKLLTGKWRQKPEQKEEDKMYCSEYVAWVWDIPESYKMSPEDVWNYCLARRSRIIAERH